MYSYSLVSGVLEEDSQRKMVMITERNSVTGGRTNGRPSSSPTKVPSLTTS